MVCNFLTSWYLTSKNSKQKTATVNSSHKNRDYMVYRPFCLLFRCDYGIFEINNLMDSFLQYEHINIEEVCRICLSKKEQMSFISEAGLSDLLFECASIQVSDEDILHFVCNACANEVSRWYIFKEQLIQSFEIGRWLIQQKNLKKDLLYENSFSYQVTSPVTNHINNTEQNVSCSAVGGKTLMECEQDLKSINFPLAERNIRSRISTCCYNEESPNDDDRLENVSHLGTINQTCDICQKSCPSNIALLRHKKVHKEAKDYICTKCGKAFKQSQTLADHMKRHYDLKKYVCDYCGKRFYKQYNVTMHLRMHTGEKPYKCKECDKAFTRPLLLRNHIKQRHTNDKKYICQICEKGFIDGWQLKIHMRTHTGEKPHECPHCDMAFAVSSSLQSHIRYKHTFEKKYICSVCAKAFTAKHTLDDHMRTHTGERKPPRHECPTCGKKCESTSTLKYHIRAAHTGEKPFVCEICQKRFVRKQHLTAHMRNHTGEKPYVCATCGKAFGSSSTFSIHKRIHTGERPFVCNICNSAFIQSAGLKQHMRTHNKLN